LFREKENEEAKRIKRGMEFVGWVFAIFGGAILLFVIAVTIYAYAILSPPPPTEGLLGALLPAVVVGVLCFVQAYGLRHLKKWSLYTTAALTFFLWVYLLFSMVTNPEGVPGMSLFSLIAGGFLAYLYRVRKYFN